MPDTPKIALVTGAAKRIGAEIARHLHAAHFNLVIHYHHSATEALALADELNNLRENSAIALKADLNNQDQLTALAQQASSKWQGIHLLVNNASSFYPTPFDKANGDDWDDLIGSNLKAPYFLAQALAAQLTTAAGSIINIADIYADKPLRNHSIYSIAKAGNLMLTKSLAQELAPRVRVNGIAPGAILWPDGNHKKKEDTLSDEDKEKVLCKIPLQQRGQAQDIAKAILFLVNDAPYVTGQILTVDGGRSLTI
ncbi:pteridine reductase [Cellvibrio sp. QJXJ]|uniref:pteridine reductase n=1 Tax=Cellvibrio sp. QJXJ TaxID=2964606 RepID=UPI0021C43028|nr:pteridine reductase [Cellvibrio sp. QJXJ]UUA74805.1 pteridine reductase [Cellvibrio sp. QJXJ]